MRPLPAIACLLLPLALAPGAARSDIYELKDGGAVVGEAAPGKEGDGYVIKTADGVQLTLKRDQVQRIVAQGEASAEYAERSRSAPDTADSHRQLAAWCVEHGMKAEAAHHLARVTELDPNDEQARASLGLQKVNGRWITRDQFMIEHGLQLHEGEYRTPQDISIRQGQKQSLSHENDWFAKLRLWRGWLEDRRAGRVEEAQRQIAAINDPQAAAALVKLLDSEDDPWVFKLLLETLGRLDDPLVLQTLVSYSLEDDSPEVRDQCLDYLISGRRPVSIVPYVQALKDKDNTIVNRAGAALGRIGNPAAISPLIDALVTRHKHIVQGDDPGRVNAAFSPSGAGGGGLSMGGNGPKEIVKEHQNPDVQRALVKLSGSHEFDFDKQAWRRWYVDLQMREHVNSRRDK